MTVVAVKRLIYCTALQYVGTTHVSQRLQNVSNGAKTENLEILSFQAKDSQLVLMQHNFYSVALLNKGSSTYLLLGLECNHRGLRSSCMSWANGSLSSRDHSAVTLGLGKMLNFSPTIFTPLLIVLIYHLCASLANVYNEPGKAPHSLIPIGP